MQRVYDNVVKATYEHTLTTLSNRANLLIPGYRGLDMPSPTSKRPTMLDVARRAGVSLKTVSRVVNDEGGVSPTFSGPG